MKDLSLTNYISHDCHVMLIVFLPIIIRAVSMKDLSLTNPNHWLKDYWLIMGAGGANNDFVVQYLPLLLSSSARAWLE